MGWTEEKGRRLENSCFLVLDSARASTAVYDRFKKQHDKKRIHLCPRKKLIIGFGTRVVEFVASN